MEGMKNSSVEGAQCNVQNMVVNLVKRAHTFDLDFDLLFDQIPKKDFLVLFSLKLSTTGKKYQKQKVAVFRFNLHETSIQNNL